MAATLNLSSSKLPKIIREATKSLFQVFLSFKDNLVAFLLELERGGDLLVDGPGNLAAVLLELEGGGDLLVDGPGKGVDVLLELKRGGDLLVDSPGKFYLSLREVVIFS